MFRLRKLMPLFVTVILAGLIILPMWAADTEKDNAAANEIATLEQLKAAFENGGSYKVTKDIVSDTYIEGYKDITLDLNGHTLSRTNITGTQKGQKDRFFFNQRDGLLTLNNSASTIGLILAKAADGADTASPRTVAANAPNPDETHPNGYHPKVIVNAGVKLVVEGNGNEHNNAHALGVYTNNVKKADKIVSTAEAVVNKGAVLCGNGTTARAVAAEGYGTTLNIKGGKFTGVAYCVASYAGVDTIIEDGEFFGEEKCIKASNTPQFIINGGNFTAGNSHVLRVGMSQEDYPEAYDRGHLTVNGGTFTGTLKEDTAEASRGYLQIYGGKFTQYPGEYAVGNANIVNAGKFYEVQKGKTEKVLTTADEVINLLPRGGFFKLGADIVMPPDNKLGLFKDTIIDLNGHKLSKHTTYTSSGRRAVITPLDGKIVIKNTAEKVGEIQGISEKDGEVYGTPRAIWISVPSDYGNESCGRHVEVEIDSGVKLSTVRADGGRSELQKAHTIGIYMGDDYDPGTIPGGWNTKDSLKSTAKLTINDGVIMDAIGNAVSVEDYGAYIVINGGEFTSKRHTISSSIGAEVTINGGKFVADEESGRAVSVRQGIAKIYGGTFTGKKNVIVLTEDQEYYPGATDISKAVVKGGTFNGDIELVEGLVAKCDLSISGGKYTVDPTDWLAEGCKVEKIDDYFVVGGGSGPSKPILPEDVPEDIEKDPAVDAPSKEDVIKTAPVFADKVVTINGMAYVKVDDAKVLAAKAFASEKIEAVTPLPIFKATIAEAEKVVAVSVNISGSEILNTANTVDELKLVKLADGKSFEYEKISSAAEAKDGTFMLLEAFGTPATGAIKADTTYQLVMFIEDNGKYDLDRTEKVVLDPATLVKTSSDKPSPSGSGGGGCNAGFGMLALLCAVPMMFRKKQ